MNWSFKMLLNFILCGCAMAKAIIISSIFTSVSECKCINTSPVSLSSIIVLRPYVLRHRSGEMVCSTSHVVTGSTARIVEKPDQARKMSSRRMK